MSFSKIAEREYIYFVLFSHCIYTSYRSVTNWYNFVCFLTWRWFILMEWRIIHTWKIELLLKIYDFLVQHTNFILYFCMIRINILATIYIESAISLMLFVNRCSISNLKFHLISWMWNINRMANISIERTRCDVLPTNTFYCFKCFNCKEWFKGSTRESWLISNKLIGKRSTNKLLLID